MVPNDSSDGANPENFGLGKKQGALINECMLPGWKSECSGDKLIGMWCTDNMYGRQKTTTIM